MENFRRLAASLTVAALIVSSAVARDYRLTVAPVGVDRAAQVIVVKLPPDAREARSARGADGVYPLQVDSDGTARLVVPEQKAGQTREFQLQTAAANLSGGVAVTSDRQRVRVVVAGRPAFDYQMDRETLPRADIAPEFKRAGYIHPVYSPAGKIVTDDYPSNHVHHHGIWSPWTKTSFQGRSPDFWNMQAKTGAEDFVALDRTWSGTVHGGFESRLKMVDLSAPAPVTVLNETWRVTAYQVAGASGGGTGCVFDLEVTQTCATGDPLLLPTYHYGGFGFRGAAEWNGEGGAIFLTSEGETDRVKGNATRGRWCYLGGRISGAIAGTAVLGHPGNFRAPQPMRLHPNMPYLSYVPQHLGDFAIEPGKPYVMRFRFVASDGAPDQRVIDAYWNGYALQPEVKLEAVR